ncbi:unnamed protein product [Brassica oleracea var. botrytis]
MEKFTSTFSSKALRNKIPSSSSLIYKIDMKKASRFVSKIDVRSGQFFFSFFS